MNRFRRQLRLLVVAGALALALVLVAAALAANRTDRSFGQNGVASIPAPKGAAALRVGPVVFDLVGAGGGKTVAALGDFRGNSNYIAAARFRADGSPDPSFGEGGFAEAVGVRDGVVTGIKNGQGQAVARQRDGKVVLVGYQTSPSSSKSGPVLVRFDVDGKLDEDFGQGGKVAVEPSEAKDETIHAVAIQASGRIIGVGGKREHTEGQPAGLVLAYRSDGSVDRSFGKGGRLLFPARRGRGEYTGFRAVRALPSGKLLIAGYSRGRLQLLRLTPNGRPDRSFSGDGQVTINVGENEGCSQDCGLDAPFVIQPGGRIVAAANLSLGSFVLVGVNPNGSLDYGFGRGGFARSSKGFFRANGLAIDGNGRLVIAGIGERGSARNVRIVFSAVRYLPNGAVDRGFGRGGTETLAVGESSAAFGAATQPSGRVVVGGGVQFPSGSHRLLLTRYLSG